MFLSFIVFIGWKCRICDNYNECLMLYCVECGESQTQLNSEETESISSAFGDMTVECSGYYDCYDIIYCTHNHIKTFGFLYHFLGTSHTIYKLHTYNLFMCKRML